MIGVWSAQAQSFLLVLAGVTGLLFSAPLTFAPLRWARLFLWRTPEENNLALYFGRCLGAFALVLNAMMLRAALSGEGVVTLFQLMLLLWLAMIAVHVVGALQRVQPITETLEIGFWLILMALTAAFWPTGLGA